MDCNRPGNFAAGTWISVITWTQQFTTRGRALVQQDERRKAMISLTDSISEVGRHEDDTRQSLRNIAEKVKATNKAHKAPLRELLLSSKTQRNKLSLVVKKRASLQQHLETLQTSELNQQVLVSVQQTSQVLKSMGLDQKIDNVEELMMDLAESHDDVRNIQNGLGTSYGEDPDNDELEAELALLISEDVELDQPIQNNSMTASVSKDVNIVAPLLPVLSSVQAKRKEPAMLSVKETGLESKPTYVPVAQMAMAEI